MQKKLPPPEVFRKFMTLTLLQIILSGITVAFTYANTASGQELLNSRISIHAKEREIAEVLELIQREVQIHFVYSFELIRAGRKVNLDADQEKLKAVLDGLLEPMGINYKVSNDNVIVLKPASEAPHEIRATESAEASLYAMQVSGKVTDEQGQPLPGVNIIEKGTTNGTSTDADGKYLLSVSGENTVLIFSFIGYITEERTPGSQSVIDVTMTPDISTLSEVVVVGYGIQSQKEITSSIVSVKSEDFNRGNVSNPAQLLQGKVPGLTVARAGGDPNQPFVIRLRGLATLGANSEPLIIVDGFIGASFNSIDPNDIESIDVLKDASAGAIYGTRASSGVIIITTKSGGKKSKPILEYSAFAALEEISNSIHVATPEEFLEYGGQDLGYRTNWLDQVAGTGVTNVHNIAVSNNVGDLSYRASFNYRSVEGVLKGTGFDQLNGRINITQKLLNERLKLTAIVSNTRKESTIGYAQALRYSMNFNPTAPVYVNNDPSQGYFETNVQDVFNPVALNELNTNINRTSTLLTNFAVTYEAVKGLNFSANYSFQTVEILGGTYLHSESIFGSPSGQSRNGIATRTSDVNTNELFEMTGNYEAKWGKLKYSLLSGYSWNEQVGDNFSAQNTDYISNDVTFDNLGLGQGINNKLASVGSAREEARLISFFGRTNFNFADTYFLSASLRHEGSSRFGDNNRWGDFWAISGGVNINELVAIPKVDALKLRIGYGVTGNLPSQNYAYLETLGSGSLGYVNGTYVSSIQPSSNPNPDLKWEKKGEFNAGLDFSLLDFRLTGSVDYFNRNTKDLLNTISVPTPPNLYGSTLVNIGEMKTTGAELAFNYKAIQKNDFTWTIGTNYSSYVTTLNKYNNNDSTVIYRGNIGAPGLNYTYIIKVADGERIGQIVSSPFVRYDENGRSVMRDRNGNETLTRDTRDFVTVGNGLPKFSMGLNNTFTYKNFDLNVFLRGVFGHSLANINRAYYEHPSLTGRYNIVITDKFNADDTETEAWHSNYVEKASFVRLDNATLGYNFKLRESSKLRSIRLYATGQNLFTITNYTGSDPEARYYDTGPITEGNSQSTYSGDILTPGIDNRVTYFPTRTYTFGLNVTF